MFSYIRGPVCGTDNCPSRLWRIIDGRRTCQYGHVMEGDIQVNNEDDDYAAGGLVTRRLNLTTSATGNFQSSLNVSQQLNSNDLVKDKRIYGYDANILFLKSYQYILKKQCRWLTREKGFPSDFTKVVKLLWMKFLKSVNDNDHRIGGMNGQEDENGTQLKASRRNRRQRHSKTLELHISTSLAFLYIAALHIGLPVYASDFLKWICTSDMPYFKSYILLPKQWIERLPNFYLGLLEGGIPPHDGQFYKRVVKLAFRLNLHSFLATDFNYEGLILKLSIFFVLPPSIYLYTTDIIKTLEGSDSFSLFETNSTSSLSYHVVSEVRALSYFILTIRWLLLSNIDNQFPDNWISATLKDNTVASKSKETIANDIAKLVYDSAKENVFIWEDNKTLEYLNWAENNFLPKQKLLNDRERNIDKKIAQRKLLELFPLDTKTLPNSTMTYLSNATAVSRNPLGSSENFDGGSETETPANNMEIDEQEAEQSVGNNFEVSFIDELQEKYIKTRNNIEMGDEPHSSETRIQLIKDLEEKFLHNISLEFALSKQQLKDSVKHLEKFCIKKINI